MKNLFFLLTVAALTVSFNACNKDNSTDLWREANTNYYNDSIAKNPAYTEIQTKTGPSGVYKRIINSGTGTEHPLQTSKVKVLYNATYYDGTTFDAGTSLNNTPVEFSLGGQSVIRGFSFALQQMVVGDKWEIGIPYYLGYGSSDYVSPATYQVICKAYTTLVFQVELVGITQYP